MKKVMNIWIINEEGDPEEARSVYGAKVVARRRKAGKVARNSRRANYAVRARQRRLRQKRERRNAAR